MIEGFLRPVLDNAFLFLVEFLALPCAIAVSTSSVIPYLTHSGISSGELFWMVLVCAREAVWF